jgi:protocatechuate 3,4-dioxygenase beta subunit
VFRPDGRTPAAGVTVYAYQTDLTGRYAPPPGPPRLRGWMTTDAEGRFEYLTIRPAPYPGWTTPAHIHHQLWGGGAAPQYNEDILFDDDPLVGAADRRRSEERGRFGSVRRPVRGADGVLEVVHDMRLKAAADAFEDNIRHGLEACGLA